MMKMPGMDSCSTALMKLSLEFHHQRIFQTSECTHPNYLVMSKIVVDLTFRYEFKAVNDGKAALYIAHKAEYLDLSDHPEISRGGWAANMGFQEVDIATGEVQFEWWALDHVSVSASNEDPMDLEGPPPSVWNPL